MAKHATARVTITAIFAIAAGRYRIDDPATRLWDVSSASVVAGRYSGGLMVVRVRPGPNREAPRLRPVEVRHKAIFRNSNFQEAAPARLATGDHI